RLQPQPGDTFSFSAPRRWILTSSSGIREPRESILTAIPRDECGLPVGKNGQNCNQFGSRVCFSLAYHSQQISLRIAWGKLVKKEGKHGRFAQTITAASNGDY